MAATKMPASVTRPATATASGALRRTTLRMSRACRPSWLFIGGCVLALSEGELEGGEPVDHAHRGAKAIRRARRTVRDLELVVRPDRVDVQVDLVRQLVADGEGGGVGHCLQAVAAGDAAERYGGGHVRNARNDDGYVTKPAAGRVLARLVVPVETD